MSENIDQTHEFLSQIKAHAIETLVAELENYMKSDTKADDLKEFVNELFEKAKINKNILITLVKSLVQTDKCIKSYHPKQFGKC